GGGLRARDRGGGGRGEAGVDIGPRPGDRRDGWRRRVLGLTALAMAGFVGLLGQLWYLQALEGGRLQEMSEKNRIRIRPVTAPRGILFRRNRRPPVDHRPAVAP